MRSPNPMTMTSPDPTLHLEDEWDLGTGFFGQLREGTFDAAMFERTMTLLRTLPRYPDDISRRLVSLVWYIPTFVDWQREQCVRAGCAEQAYEQAANQLRAQAEEILGYP